MNVLTGRTSMTFAANIKNPVNLRMKKRYTTFPYDLTPEIKMVKNNMAREARSPCLYV